MNEAAILKQLDAALTRAKGNKSLAKKYLLEAAAADHALLLVLAQPFLDSIAGYALDLYARKNDIATSDGPPSAGVPAETKPKPEPVVSAKQKAAMELIAASYKKKS